MMEHFNDSIYLSVVSVCVPLDCGFLFFFLFLLISLPLSTVGFACAHLHISAIAVACTDPGLVPHFSSSVTLSSSGTSSSSLDVSSETVSVFVFSGVFPPSAINMTMLRKHCKRHTKTISFTHN